MIILFRVMPAARSQPQSHYRSLVFSCFFFRRLLQNLSAFTFELFCKLLLKYLQSWVAILFTEWVEHIKGTLQFLRENTSWLYHKIICMWSIKLLVKTLPTYTKKTTWDISIQQTFHQGLCAAQYAIMKALSFNFHFHSILSVMKFKPLLILQASHLISICILKGFHLYIYSKKQWHFLNAICILVNLSKIASHLLGKLSKILSDFLSDFMFSWESTA